MKHNNEARKTGGCLYKLLVFFLVITLGFGSCQKEDAIEIESLFLQKAANISTVWKMDNSPSPVYLQIIAGVEESLLYYVRNGSEDCWYETNYLSVESNATNINQTVDILEIVYDNGTITQTYVFSINSITSKLEMQVTETTIGGSGGGYTTTFTADTTDLTTLNYCE